MHNTELNIVKRQDGVTGIPEYTKPIQQGAVPPKLNIGNIRLHDVSAASITNKAVELYMQAPEPSRIIGATYKVQHGGIDIINARCQELYNPTGQRFEFELYGQKHYLGIKQDDSVIFT